MYMLPVGTSEQAARVADIAVETWYASFENMIPDEQIDYMMNGFQSFNAIWNSINDGARYYLIYDDDDNEAGYCCLVDENGVTFLSKLYILPEHQCKGLGKAAMDEIVEMCKAAGSESLYLTVNRGNAKAISFYRKYGFIVSRDQVKDIGNGFVMDDHIMEYAVR